MNTLKNYFKIRKQSVAIYRYKELSRLVKLNLDHLSRRGNLNKLNIYLQKLDIANTEFLTALKKEQQPIPKELIDKIDNCKINDLASGYRLVKFLAAVHDYKKEKHEGKLYVPLFFGLGANTYAFLFREFAAVSALTVALYLFI